MNEAVVIINGHTLTEAQSLALRVAVSSFYTDMKSDPVALGDDEHGRSMVTLYRDRLGEVLRKIANGS